MSGNRAAAPQAQSASTTPAPQPKPKRHNIDDDYPGLNAAMGRLLAARDRSPYAPVPDRTLDRSTVELLGTLLGPVDNDEALAGSLRAWQLRHGLPPTGTLDDSTGHTLVSALIERQDTNGAVRLVTDLYDMHTGTTEWVAETAGDSDEHPYRLAEVECYPEGLDPYQEPSGVDVVRLILSSIGQPGPGSTPGQYATFVSTILHESVHLEDCDPHRIPYRHDHAVLSEEFVAHLTEAFPTAPVPAISPAERLQAIVMALHSMRTIVYAPDTKYTPGEGGEGLSTYKLADAVERELPQLIWDWLDAGTPGRDGAVKRCSHDAAIIARGLLQLNDSIFLTHSRWMQHDPQWQALLPILRELAERPETLSGQILHLLDEVDSSALERIRVMAESL